MRLVANAQQVFAHLSPFLMQMVLFSSLFGASRVPRRDITVSYCVVLHHAQRRCSVKLPPSTTVKAASRLLQWYTMSAARKVVLTG